ncbi:MAG: VOC family protein [Litoreibacter sp.]
MATDKPDAARAFFSDIMGLELREATPFALVFLDRCHVLRVQIIPEFEPVGYTVHGWQVGNIVDEVEDLSSKGVLFQRFDQLDQDKLGIWTTPDGSKIAWFSDPSGNTLSLSEYAQA